MNKLELKAYIFAKHAHESINQRRKYTNEPYINHLRNVVNIISKVPHDELMLSAAWLHDTVEDTYITIEDINKKFGSEISTLVYMLTDISKKEDGNRIRRKNMDLIHLSHASSQAKTIKLADLIDNSESIIQYGCEFSKIYLVEISRLLRVLSDGDCHLFKIAIQKNETGIKFISEKENNDWFHSIYEKYDNDLKI